MGWCTSLVFKTHSFKCGMIAHDSPECCWSYPVNASITTLSANSAERGTWNPGALQGSPEVEGSKKYKPVVRNINKKCFTFYVHLSVYCEIPLNISDIFTHQI